MRRHLGALVLTAALAGIVTGCGDDELAHDVVPRSTPELTVPQDTSLGSSSAATNTTDTTTTDTTATTPATPAPSTQATPAPSTGGTAPQTGGTGGTGGDTTPDTGGASPGAFSEFCRQNPGACPDQ